MGPVRRRGNEDWIQAVVRGERFDRTSALGIDSGGPSDFVDKGFCRNELAGLTVESVEESVLRRLHDDLAGAAVDRQIREH